MARKTFRWELQLILWPRKKFWSNVLLKYENLIWTLLDLMSWSFIGLKICLFWFYNFSYCGSLNLAKIEVTKEFCLCQCYEKTLVLDQKLLDRCNPQTLTKIVEFFFRKTFIYFLEILFFNFPINLLVFLVFLLFKSFCRFWSIFWIIKIRRVLLSVLKTTYFLSSTLDGV